MDRRQEPRHPFSCQFEGTLSNSPSQLKNQPNTLSGAIVDVSAGGACVVTDEPAEPFALLQARFRVPGVPVPIPSLMQVRWVRQQAPVPFRKGSFRLGLAFLT